MHGPLKVRNKKKLYVVCFIKANPRRLSEIFSVSYTILQHVSAYFSLMRYNDIYSRQFQWTLKWNIIIFQNWLLPFMYFLPWLLNYIVFFIKLFSRNLNLNQNTDVCLSMATSCFYVTYPFWWWTIMDLHSFLFFVTLSNISIVLTPCSAFLYSSSLGSQFFFPHQRNSKYPLRVHFSCITK